MITILGTGQVGKAVLDQLQIVRPESAILLVNRSGKAPFDLPKGTNIVGMDATDPGALVDVFQKSDLVFVCMDVPYQNWQTFYPLLSDALVAGLKNTAAKLIFADNMYSYGNRKGEPLYETLAHTAKTQKGKIRADVIKNFERNGLQERVAIVKSSDFIGPRIEKGVFGIDFLANVYRNKAVNLPGNIKLPHHFTFIEDFAKAMVLVAFEPVDFNGVWHVPNAPAISQKDWIDLFRKHTGRPIKYRTIPKIVVKLVGMFNPFVRELQELSYQFEYPYLVNAQRFIEKFGDIATPHDQIVQKTIDWYRETVV